MSSSNGRPINPRGSNGPLHPRIYFNNNKFNLLKMYKHGTDKQAKNYVSFVLEEALKN